jgi:serine/threonine protein kinase
MIAVADDRTSELPPTVFAPPPELPQSATSHADVKTRLTPTDELPSGDLEPAPVPGLPRPGQRFDDFDILAVLGSGAFARVYLARQVSLGRQVALKVSANRGSEARTLASLEHEHIVRVFSETVNPDKNLRLLCMQFVAGTTLEKIIEILAGREPRTWSGQAILDAVDRLSIQPALFDPAASRDREFLGNCDFIEAVCWLGARLAEALAHAHSQGVLHRDIKPANILINRYGRPLLADFNIALDPQRLHGPGGEIFGGTLSYMSPEHLDAFNPDEATPPEAVDERSDIYSFGVVLFELLTGRLPFDSSREDAEGIEELRALAGARRADMPRVRREGLEIPDVLERAVRRCLDPEPGRRYQSAAELARALEGCGALSRVEKLLPAPTILGRDALTHPFAWVLVFGLLPHLLGSVVNISYNALRIVGDLTPNQRETFTYLALAYNLVVYPLMGWLIYRQTPPLYRAWRDLSLGVILDADSLTALRRQTLRLPMWAVGLSCLGWLPGGLLFPLGLDLFAGPISAGVFGHFLVSFTISGLIALTYCYFAVQFVVLRVFYPRLWVDGQEMRETAREELRSLDQRLRVFQLCAGLIPLAGAALMIGVGPEQFTLTFRLLATGLIALGMAGFGLALLVSGRLGQTLSALMGVGRRQ